MARALRRRPAPSAVVERLRQHTPHQASGAELLHDSGPPTRPVPRVPPPPAAEATPEPGRLRPRPAVVVLAALCTGGVVAAVVASLVLFSGPGRGPTRPRPEACAPVTSPMTADADGDGCPSAVTWTGNVLEVEGRRYQLGRPGDRLLLGDWDCDGRDTPALYRPAGEVFYFDAWAEDDQVLPATSRGGEVSDGTPEVVHDGNGCDRLVVR